ncbi:polysaccharide pyruvyl transferase family protein [Bacillus sp. ISL-18]|uniref:polysaccharide pyruvyl transferase family protein n=1 Tax=Bacillus sp. ISL-18 TaxID=2819118 RepID=UPI001BE9E1E5|nr:polysaccharide pyruvyl transferase family protein [Bacillus sp. ISL-18]MBT2658624.1 polysaccharide pyruvyl transferase family protein [Bacillus sp. ISL-18]
MRIAVDAYFDNNLGDDLFLDILVNRYENSDFDFLINDQSAAKAFINHKRVNFKSRKEVLLNIFKYDAYLFIGGSMFQEPENWKKQWKTFDTTIKIFKFFRKDTFVLGCNFGPIKTNEYKEKYVSTFKKLSHLTVRDQYSFESLDNKGIEISVHPDIVLGKTLENRPERNSNLIGISIIDWPKNNNIEGYIHFNVDLIKRLHAKNKSVRLFAFQDTQEISDLTVINKVIEKVDNIKNIDIVSYDGDIKGFLEKYDECYSMVTCRFHSFILSLLMNQRICPIIYSDKTLNTMKFLGINIRHFELDSISNGKSLDEVENSLLNYELTYEKSLISELSCKATQHFAVLDTINRN